MRLSPFHSTLVAAAFTAALLGCNPQDSTQPTGEQSDITPTSAPVRATTDAFAARSGLPDFDPKDFVRGVDNPLFPLPPGRRLVYHGSEDGAQEVIITEVTRDHKTILGVPVVVVLDRVVADGELAEKTFDWYAQDKHGNVWYFGEDTKEFEDGKVVSTAGSFEAGKNGARAGVIMRAHPKVGLTTPQESAPGVAEDRARVVDKNVTVTVPAGTFRHCIRSAEFTPLEPELLENKWYCPGVGITRERDLRGGTGRTALVQIEQH